MGDETLDKIISQNDDGPACNTFGDETNNKIGNIIKQYNDGSVCNTFKDETMNKVDNIIKQYVEMNCAVENIENNKRFEHKTNKPKSNKELNQYIEVLKRRIS